jgi:iron-sulfur cluster assembly accessory protein
MEQFALTDRAAARIAEIVAAEGQQAALRVAVLAGGCSGFQYRFELDPTAQVDDLVIERAGAKVERVACTDRYVARPVDFLLNLTPLRYLMFNAFLVAKRIRS